MEFTAHNYRTTLAAAQTTGDTTLQPATLTGAPAGYPFRLLVGTEIEIVTGLAAAGVWTVTRGAEGTAAGPHALGTAVDAIITAGQFAALWAAIAESGGLPPEGPDGDVLTVVAGAWASAAPTGGGGSSDTPPVLADFAWVNQGTATALDTAAGLYMNHPAAAGEILHMLQRPLPASPYIITVKVIPDVPAAAYGFAGLAFRDNVGGTGMMWGLKYDTPPFLEVQAFNAVHTASAGPAAQRPVDPVRENWLQLADDGTNRHYRYSLDGVNFRTVLSQPVATTPVPTHVALAVSSGQATYPAAATFADWKVA